MHCPPCVSEGYRMSRTDTPPDASASRVIAPTSSYCCPGPKPAALWPMRQGWSSTRGLVPRARESGRLLHRGGMDTQTGSGARTWALRLSCGVLVEAAEKALCDRISSLVRRVRSPWDLSASDPAVCDERRCQVSKGREEGCCRTHAHRWGEDGMFGFPDALCGMLLLGRRSQSSSDG